jgi:hypothetical protein
MLGEEAVEACFKLLSIIGMERLRRIWKSLVIVVGAPAKAQTGYPLNADQKRYRLSQLARIPRRSTALVTRTYLYRILSYVNSVYTACYFYKIRFNIVACKPLLGNDIEMGAYTRAVSGQRLGKNISVARQQNLSNATVGLW